jgi:hypothetical protein
MTVLAGFWVVAILSAHGLLLLVLAVCLVNERHDRDELASSLRWITLAFALWCALAFAAGAHLLSMVAAAI